MQKEGKKEALHKYIKYNYSKGSNIPPELLYPGWQTDRDKYGDTPLMICIRHNYMIPSSEFFYPGWQSDKNDLGETPLMIYIISGLLDNTDLEQLLYPGWETDRDKNGNTPLMRWILMVSPHRTSLPPGEFFYSDWQNNEYKSEKTTIQMWYMFNVNKQIPDKFLIDSVNV